jgi:hypothetical protein
MTHLIVWIILSLIFFFSSESFTKLIAPDFHEVTMWLTVMMTGLILIFIGVTTSLTIRLIIKGSQGKRPTTKAVSHGGTLAD